MKRIFLAKKRQGSAIVIATITIGFLLLATLGVSTIITASYRSSTNVERSNNAFFAAESGIELALYEMSEHSSGFEVTHLYADDDYSHVNLKSVTNSEGWWSAESLDVMDNALDTIIIIPNQDNPNLDSNDPDTWTKWSEASLGSNVVIKLYSDNTSCSSEAYCLENPGHICGKPCE